MEKKQKILVICPYENIYPPVNGGMQRCFHIMHQIVRHFKLTAIINQDKQDFLQCIKEYPALDKANIYSTRDVKTKDILNLLPSKLENAFRSRWYQREWDRPADGNLIKYYPVLTRLLKEHKYDAIILENIVTLNAVKIIRRFDSKVKIIYDAHNVDTKLAKAAFERKEISSTRLQDYFDCERNLHKMVNAVFTCSADDKTIFMEMNQGKLLAEVVPNGVSIPERNYDRGVKENIPEYILFCGSLWSIPNAEGLYWFCKKIWPLIIDQFPSLKLLVVGSGRLPAKYEDIANIHSIEFTGVVDDVKPWYNKASLTVVPLLTGSGTRLKVLESMALGVPVVSTSIGAEGIAYSDSKDIVIAGTDSDFAEKVIMLLNDKEQRLTLQENAGKLAEKKYNWNIIGKGISKFLNNN